jgi:hypothetical protein
VRTIASGSQPFLIRVPIKKKWGFEDPILSLTLYSTNKSQIKLLPVRLCMSNDNVEINAIMGTALKSESCHIVHTEHPQLKIYLLCTRAYEIVTMQRNVIISDLPSESSVGGVG